MTNKKRRQQVQKYKYGEKTSVILDRLNKEFTSVDFSNMTNRKRKKQTQKCQGEGKTSGVLKQLHKKYGIMDVREKAVAGG